jgi:site-specific DNA-methyltransferase (adenine-specific)
VTLQQPFYQSDRVTLYHGDCLEILPHLSKADAIVTDIPYNVVNRPIGKMHSYRSLDKGVADSSPVDLEVLVPLIAQHCIAAYVFCSTEQVSDLRRLFVKNRMTTRQGCWVKTNASPLNADKLYLSAVELCIYARKVNALFNRFCEWPVWRGPSERVEGFPCAKPVWLMRDIIDASTPIDGQVLDPYMGSGTTGVAALQHGRRFVGIEKELEYCELAKERIEVAEQKELLPL